MRQTVVTADANNKTQHYFVPELAPAFFLLVQALAARENASVCAIPGFSRLICARVSSMSHAGVRAARSLPH